MSLFDTLHLRDYITAQQLNTLVAEIRLKREGNVSEGELSQVEKDAELLLPNLMKRAGMGMKEHARKAFDDAFEAKLSKLNKAFGPPPMSCRELS